MMTALIASNGFRRSPQLEQARKARRILEKVRGNLLRPTVEALHSGVAGLKKAVECLEALEAQLRLPLADPAARHAVGVEIAGLRKELRAVEKLAAAAGKFFEGWARLASVFDQSTANYTAGGQTAAVNSLAGRVMLDG